MGSLFSVRAFITYWLDVVDAHSLHSPFFYDFYRQVLHAESKKDFTQIENIRKELLTNKQIISYTDLGASSKHFKTTTRAIQHIARTSIAPPKFALLYHRILEYFQLKTVFELGTSFGITTLYLSQGQERKVTTFEGIQPIAEVARRNFKAANATNIRMIEGNLDTTLPSCARDVPRIDFVLMDANHRLEPTLRYFHYTLPRLHTGSIVLIDDIHDSEEMETAWNTIRKHQQVYGSIDLFRAGILFFDPSLNKQHVVLQY